MAQSTNLRSSQDPFPSMAFHVSDLAVIRLWNNLWTEHWKTVRKTMGKQDKWTLTTWVDTFCGHFRGHLRGTFRGSFRGESMKGWEQGNQLSWVLMGLLAEPLVGPLWRESSRGNTIRGNKTESLWEGNLPLRGSLRGPLKTSANL